MSGLNRISGTRLFPVGAFLLMVGLFSATAFAENVVKPNSSQGIVPDSPRCVLTASPRELNLGTLGPGEDVTGTFCLKNKGSGVPEWTAETPKGWTLVGKQNLAGTIGKIPGHMKLNLDYVREVGTSAHRSCSLILRLADGTHSAAFHRDVPVGELREEVRFGYNGGTASLFFRVNLVALTQEPLLDLEPLRIDYGTIRPGEEKATQRILLKNRGREPLTWKVDIAGDKGMPAAAQTQGGQYISFHNEAVATGVYPVTGLPQEGLELTGHWEEDNGYPSGQGEQNTLRYRYVGTGIGLYYWKSPEGGPIGVYIDEQFVKFVDGRAERRQRAEELIAQGQPEGSHLLTIVNGAGKVSLEGVRILGKTIQKGPRGWITVFPDNGFTARETDFVNVALNTQQLASGIYGDQVFFTSNGGEADIEVFVEVAAEAAPQFLDVHRYLSGYDYFYTTNPQAEASRLRSKGYRHMGIAFRLFTPGTPATTDFFRWFNPAKGDHYYSYDPKGGKPLAGYIFEGSVGNIATSRLTGTRALYRWFNPDRGSHFYTTDQNGEGLAKKGYLFDGIAGFVH
jgi:hypothetical protein